MCCEGLRVPVFADAQQFFGGFLDLKTETAHTHIPRCKNANVPGISETAVIFLALHIR